ncbi:hypothetical protein PNOK_0062200 [Pyrrhoderma noxium]|uniref:Uncharacterized protein n=1 Tax=Pyrrhoderma noxium TaxID=2282107 RepID=A0A286UVH8_9AGAM|nr:hypothetical protein PNOK_0062200 [Pyrrhoderma noxium]
MSKSKRLASFNGPSTPTSSPVRAQQLPSTPQSPSRNRDVETPYHRKVRSLLQDVQNITRTWDALVKIDGRKAITELTDTRTDLDNVLGLVPDQTHPHTRLVGPRLDIMERCIHDLDSIISKLRKQFSKLNLIMDNFEELVHEAHKLKGWAWVQSEPLWCTWTLERFATKMPDLLPPYHRSLQVHTEMVESLRSHSISFEESRKILAKWVAQTYLESDEWVAEWEDICAAEIERWNAR